MDKDRTLSKWQRNCARAEYCSSVVFRRLVKELEGDAQAAGEILDSLLKDRFIDDGRYASAFAREKASLQGWGPVKIRFQLRSKGISDSLIDAALSEIEPEKADEKLRKLMSSKAHSLEGDPQKRLKLLKYGLGRGYGYDEVEAVLSSLE